MHIQRDIEKERWVYDRVKAWLNRHPRNGIHASDLLYPRKAYFQRKDPQPTTDTQAGYYIAGHGHHYIIEAIIDDTKSKHGHSDSGTREWEGVFFSPDIRLNLAIGEIKTSRAKYGPKDDADEAWLKKEYKLYLKQLYIYQAIEDVEEGYLIVFYLNLKQPKINKTVPTIRVFKTVVSAEERVMIREKVKAAKAKLETALVSNDHRQLELCPSFMCFDCPWAKACDPKHTKPKGEKA